MNDVPDVPDLPDVTTIASAARLGELLGDRVPPAASVTPAEIELADAARDLLDAVVATAVDDATRARVAREIRTQSEALRARRRDPVIVLVRNADGRLENLTQADRSERGHESLPPGRSAEVVGDGSVVDDVVAVGAARRRLQLR